MVLCAAGMFDFWHIMDKCTVVAKKELLYAWPFGLAAWLTGLIFIDRVHPEEAHKAMNLAAEDIKKKKVMYHLQFLLNIFFYFLVLGVTALHVSIFINFFLFIIFISLFLFQSFLFDSFLFAGKYFC